MGFLDSVLSSLRSAASHLTIQDARYVRDYLAEHGLSGAFELSARNTDHFLRGQNQIVQSSAGSILSAGQLLWGIPVGIKNWVGEIVAASPHGLGHTLYTTVAVPVRGMSEGARFLVTQGRNWVNGGLNERNAFQIARDVTFTLGTAGLMVLGARNVARGGGNMFGAIRNAPRVHVPLNMSSGLAPALASASVSLPMPTLASVAPRAMGVASGLVCMNAATPPEGHGGSSEVQNEEFNRRLQDYNSRLREFDQVGAKQRRGETLSAEEEAIRNNQELIALDRERTAFVRTNYRHHQLLSAAASGSPLRGHLEAHLTAVDLGSHFELGGDQAFVSSEAVIRFAEEQLGRAYRGEIPQGTEIPISVTTAEGRVVSGRMRFVENNAVVDGANVQTSMPGGRIVLQIIFDETIGREGVAPILDAQRISRVEEIARVERVSGGRTEVVQVVDGIKPPTNTMNIIGGSYGPSGRYGLYTVYTGRYSPPMTDTGYWAEHAFLTGDPLRTNFTPREVPDPVPSHERWDWSLEGQAYGDGRTAIVGYDYAPRQGSNLEAMIANGKVGRQVP